MPRAISAGFRAGLDDPHSDEHPLLLVTITAGATVIRVCNDVVGYELSGQIYRPALFDLELLTDEDAPPKARVTLPNIDREIGETTRALADSPGIALALYSAHDWGAELFVDPVDSDLRYRKPLGTPVLEATATNLRLIDVECDAIQLSGELGSYDDTAEPWPKTRATKDILPGVWRR